MGCAFQSKWEARRAGKISRVPLKLFDQLRFLSLVLWLEMGEGEVPGVLLSGPMVQFQDLDCLSKLGENVGGENTNTPLLLTYHCLTFEILYPICLILFTFQHS